MDMEDAIKAAGWRKVSETEYTLEIEDPCEYPDRYPAGSFSGRVYRNPTTGLWGIEFEHDERSSLMDSDTEVRIPTKPSTSSNLKPSRHSDFKPSMGPR